MSSKQRALVENVRGMIDKGERGAINAPRTEEFVVNSRGSRLHVRSDWTKAVRSLGGIKEEDQGQEKHNLLSKDAIVVLLHGMGGHTNRPSFVHAASHYRALGYKVVAFDFHGHGYSDRFMPAGPNYDAEDAKKNRAPGEVDPVEEFGSSRCLIERWEHLLDDLTCVLRALYSDGDKEEPAGMTSKVPEHKLFLHATQDTPFFLMGTSMGGAIALLMGSILQKMVKSNGQGLCGGALPGAHCDEDFLEKYGNGADGGLKKSCLTPTLHYTEQAADVLLRPFFLAPSSFLIAATKDLAFRASSVFTTPVSQNSLLVGDEEDATVPGSRPNMEAAASVEDGLTDISTEIDIDAGIGTEGAAPSATSLTGVPGDFDRSPEEEVGLPFLDASLLPIARASAGVVLMSPAISVNAPHPLLRATLDMMVAPLFPSAQMPDLLRKSIDDSASWKDPHYRDYATHDAFPRGLSYGQNMRLRTAATMLTLLDAVALEIPHMEAPFLCLMDPADAVVSVEGVRVLMQRCGESHRMYRDDVDAVPVDVDVAAYEVAASATAEQPPVPPDADSEAETASAAGGGAGEGEIPRSNAYGTFVPIAGGGHDCLANRMDECFDATATFFEKRLAAKSLEHPGLGAAGGVEL